MKRLAVLFAGLALAILAACSTTPQTAQQSVYLASSDYTAAAQLVVAYKALPRCGTPTATAICSRDNVIAQLRAADTVAYNALVAAENTVRSPGAGANAATATTVANQAIAALTAITSQLKLK